MTQSISMLCLAEWLFPLDKECDLLCKLLLLFLIYTSVFSLILRFSQFFKTTRLPHAGILRHLVSEAAGRSDLRVQQTERRSLKFFEKAFCVPASPAVA